jgi:cytochrome c-type biogenesis protein CcmH/NrfG
VSIINSYAEVDSFWAELRTLGFWLDVAVAVVTVVALLWAVRTATRAERKALTLAAAERRQTFDLEVLRDLIETLTDDMIADMLRNPEHFYRLCRARLAMLPAEELPTWRAFEHLRAGSITELARLLGLEAHLRGNVLPVEAEVLLEARGPLIDDVFQAVEARMRHP